MRVETDAVGLAGAFEVALEMEAGGSSTDDVAERLGVPVSSVDTLLAIAHALPAGDRERYGSWSIDAVPTLVAVGHAKASRIHRNGNGAPRANVRWLSGL